MCTIEVLLQCYDRFFEVIPEEKEKVELAIEDMMSQILIYLFGGTGEEEDTGVDEVTIDFSPGFHAGLRHCSISIRALCSCNTFVSSPRSHENIRYAIKETVSSVLKELFITVKIDDVIIRHSHMCELDNMFSYMA